MKLCFVINQLSNGGAERVVSVLADQFSKRGYEVEIVIFKASEEDYPLEKNVTKTLITKSNYLALAQKVIRYLKKNSADVVIGFDILPNLLCSLTALLSPKMVIISERNAPKQVRLHPILKLARRVLYPFADKIVFQTNEAMDEYRKRIRRKGTVIKNPVKEGLPIRTGVQNKEIIALGRLTYQKNYPLLLNAAKKIHELYPMYSFLIYGQGELQEQLAGQIRELGEEEYVFLKGYYSDVYQHIVDSDIYVLTSHYEGMPNSLIEAMCMGFPVVASDCPSGGPREIIAPYQNGLLFENHNEQDLIEKLSYLIEHQQEKEEMGIRATGLRELHSVQKIVKEWEKLFRQG